MKRVEVTERTVRGTDLGVLSDRLLVLGRDESEATITLDIVRESVREGSKTDSCIAPFGYDP